MDEFNYLAQSGTWWEQPWWERQDRQVFCSYPKEDIARSANVLKRYFDATWTKALAAHPRQNIVFPNLCIGGSTSALGFIVNLGKMLHLFEASEGLGRIIADLKGDKGESALLELQAAFAFAKAGYQVHFPREGEDKSPDVLVAFDSINLAIECKRLQSEAWEDWEDQLTRHLISALPETKGDRQISVQVALNPRLTQVCMSGDKEPTLNQAFLEAIAQRVLSVVSDAIAQYEIPFELGMDELAELASVRVVYRKEGEYGSVSGMERTSPPIARRIFQNGIIRACAQLPNGTPGIVVVYSEVLPAPQFFKLLFEAACRAQPDKFSDIVAVVLCSMQTIFRAPAPLIFLNRHTRFQTSIENTLGVLTSQFGGVLIDDH